MIGFPCQQSTVDEVYFGLAQQNANFVFVKWSHSVINKIRDRSEFKYLAHSRKALDKDEIEFRKMKKVKVRKRDQHAEKERRGRVPEIKSQK
jgi:hypothetical protein